MIGANTTRTITGMSVNVMAKALRLGQYKNKVLRPKKGKGSYNRKVKW